MRSSDFLAMKNEAGEADDQGPRIDINTREEAKIGALPKLLERSESSSNTSNLQKKRRLPNVLTA